jgi:hypothetical protein
MWWAAFDGTFGHIVSIEDELRVSVKLRRIPARCPWKRLAPICVPVLVAACSARGAGPADLTPVPPATDIETTLFFVGDAGAPDPDGEPVFTAVSADAIEREDVRRIVLFLGDNVYPRGLPELDDDDRGEGERRLSAQIAIAEATGAEVIFLPGNHDWDFAGQGRREHLMRAEQFGRTVGADGVSFLPAGSCPGPDVLDVGAHLRLIMLDTQWWLFPDPVEDVPVTCAQRSRDDVLAEMRRLLDTAGGREVIIAGHHPLATNGPHGGYFTLRQHIFPLTDLWSWAWIPLPVIGSLYPIARRNGISDQDLSGGLNRRMRESFETVMDGYDPLLYVAGHEHNLQVMTGTAARYHVVSGAGNYGHESSVRSGSGTLFARKASGYVRLDVQSDGVMRLGVVVVGAQGERTEVFSTLLE